MKKFTEPTIEIVKIISEDIANWGGAEFDSKINDDDEL